MHVIFKYTLLQGHICLPREHKVCASTLFLCLFSFHLHCKQIKTFFINIFEQAAVQCVTNLICFNLSDAGSTNLRFHSLLVAYTEHRAGSLTVK